MAGIRSSNKKIRPLRFDLAIALKHEMEQGSAPTVIAKGQGRIAKKIIEQAEENHIPVHHDQALAQVLNEVEVEDEIPPDLYQAVAQVLAFIYRADQGSKNDSAPLLTLQSQISYI